METKFTKGEWYLQEYTDAYTNIIRCNAGNGFETLYIGSTAHDTSEENRANAKLMASAPDLLEALLIMIEDNGYDITQPIEGFSHRTQRVIEAIKKATE